MMLTNFIVALSFKCMLNAVTYASSIELDHSMQHHKTKPASTYHLNRYLQALLKEGSPLDPRLLALSWMESRIRPNIKVGDRGRACGIYQIHARYSYPYLRRKRGFNGWVESEQRRTISKECSRLKNINYSVDSMRKLLKRMDAKNLHPCHHNSGFYGTCNPWYKKRLNYWIMYFSVQKALCSLPKGILK